MSALGTLVVARGGNPECLHCQISTLVALHVATLPDGGGGPREIATALVEIAGDLAALQPAGLRDFHLQGLAAAMRAKCAASGRVRDALERRAAEAPPSSQLVS